MKTVLRISASAAALAAIILSAPAHAADVDAKAYKDLSIQQRAMVDELPPTPVRRTAASGDNSSLVLKAALDRADGNYRLGESVTLTVETSEDSYIWVFDTGASGHVHQIFPNRYAEDNLVRAGQPVTLPAPDADYQFVASDPPGNELLTVFASTNAKPPTVGFVDRDARAGPFLALLGSAASLSKDLGIVMKRDHPKSARVHRYFRIVK